ncbi:MAG: hypothetical protein KGL39_31195 [Patescibacteria group bacterium]|nr:hypothetical protein [Patescibacteria group bacterium]
MSTDFYGRGGGGVSERTDISNLDDASAYYGLTHSATEAIPIERCEKCNATYRVEDAPGHKCSPRFNVHENPDLGDRRWNEKQTRRIEAEARHRGEEPPKPLEGKASNAGAYADAKYALKRVQEEFPDLPFIEQQKMANELATVRARAIEYTGVDPTPKTPEQRDRDYMGASTPSLMRHDTAGVGGGGGGRNRKDPPKRLRSAPCFNCQQLVAKDQVVCSCGAMLEFEEDRGGRPLKEDEPRNAARISVRMSANTFAAIQEAGIGAADALALFGVAYREGRPLDDLIQEWRVRQALPAGRESGAA